MASTPLAKRFSYNSFLTVQFSGAKGYGTKMVMHTGTCTFDVILASKFQKHLSTMARKPGVIGQGKNKKRSRKQKWTEREYHVQNYSYVAQKEVKNIYNTNQFR